MGVGIGGLTPLDAEADVRVFIEHASGNHFRIEIFRGRGKCMNVLLDGSKMLVHGIKEKNGENVIQFERTHGRDAVVVRTKFRDSIADGFFVVKLDLEPFKK